MKPRETFNTLEQNDPSEARRHAVSFLNDTLLALKSGKQPASKIAYEIAGMLATRFARSLSEDDPLLEIMIIAGELEIEPNNTKELTEELVQKIEALNT